MKPDNFEQLLRRAIAIPVVTINSADQAVPLVRALLAGGLGTIEITLRTAAGLAAAAAVRRDIPDAIVGLGTVLDKQQLRAAKEVGAHFAVSPGLDPDLASLAAEIGINYLPGVTNPSEIMTAARLGYRLLKFFPAEPSGGIPALKAFAGPFPEVKFCPTGGIGGDNVTTYLAQPNVVCVGGAWLAPEADIEAGAWDAITARSSNASNQTG